MILIKIEPWNYPGHLQFRIRHDAGGQHYSATLMPFPLWLTSDQLAERGSTLRKTIALELREARRRIREMAA